MSAWHTGEWHDGPAEWVEGDTAFLSVVFTWHLPAAYSRAVWRRSEGYRVKAGGPGLFTAKAKAVLADVAEIGGSIPDVVTRHNPMATFASRGCPVGCHFCIVPAMEGRAFTLLPDFVPRPVLCDNNLSALPADYQDHIIARYRAADVPLLDANSGFEPRTFDDEVFARWRPINRGAWRFAYDDAGDGPHVERVMRMLKDVPSRLTRVYVLIGNEPMAECLGRIRQVIAWGGEPHAQPFMKLNTLVKRPHVRFDWSEQSLRDMARWCNGRFWKYVPFAEYDRSNRSARSERPDVADLFEEAAA